MAGADEDEDEGEVEGVDRVAGDLDDGLVEFEEPGGEEAEEGGATEDGEDAQDDAGGDGPAEFFGGDALGELLGDGVEEPALIPGGFLGSFFHGWMWLGLWR